MRLSAINTVITALLLGTALTAQAATSFSTMSVEEVSALLAQAKDASDHTAASAKDAAASASEEPVLLPVSLTAEDMVSKVYGVLDTGLDKQGCVSEARRLLRLTPEEDHGALWLETDGGYSVNYYGMVPEVSAIARFGDDKVSDYGFFFLFPYGSGDKHSSIRRQADFCGSLLQEMADIGLLMDLNTATDDLFEAVGDYKGNFVDVRLLDEKGEGDSGRYILILSVEPGAFTAADDIVADL